MTDDNHNVVKLHRPRVHKARGAESMSDVAITPRSFLTMTEMEQDVFLQQLRERRLRAVEILKQADVARRATQGAMSAQKLERKQAQVQKQLDKVTRDMEKLDELILSLRTMSLQYTDVDITQV